MSVQEKIKKINIYVENYFNRLGFTSLQEINLRYTFELINSDNYYSNFFEVSSEQEAKEIVKAFFLSDYNENIFEGSFFDTSKPIYLSVDVERLQ